MTTFYGNTSDNGRVYITAQVASQNQAGNSSVIQWYFGWDYLGSPSDRQLDNGLATLDGSARYNVPGRVRDYPTGHTGTGLYQVASGSYTVFHDADGYHTTTVSGHLTGYSGAVSTMSTQNLVLPRIPKVADAPGTPSLSLAASSGPNSRNITATWSAPADNGGSGIVGYTVQCATDPAFSVNLATYTVTGTSANWTANLYATTHYVRVLARNGIGSSAYSGQATITTGADVPTAPTIGTASAVGPVSAAVSWSPPSTNNGSALTGYDVQWAQDSAFTSGVTSAAVGTSASPYTITGLNPATTYYARVRAKNAIGASPWSDSLSFLTLPSVHVPNAGGTAWADAIVYMPDATGTSWVPAQVKTPNTIDGTTWA
jgi:hypothetical protein